MTQENMMQQFKFTAADLAANKRGLLSESQQSRWAGAGQWSGSLLKTAVPLLVGLVTLVVGFIISAVVGQIVVGGLITVGLAVIGAVVIRLVMGGGQKTADIPVSVGRVEGIAHLKERLDSDEHDLTRQYTVEIGHHTFQLFRKEQFEALKNGAQYVVYFLDDGNKYILSLEEVG